MILVSKLGVILTIAMIVVASCQKTTKRKLANEWNVDFHQEEYFHLDSKEGDRYTFDNGKYSWVDTQDGAVVDTIYKGSVSSNTMTINTDGTWSSSIEYSEYNSAGGNPSPIVKVHKNTRSGIWYFAKGRKGDEFKKNELVYFYVTSLRNINYNASDPSGVYQANVELEPGAIFEIYRVIESKSKTLELKQEGYSQRYSNGDLELDRNSTFWYKLSKN